MDEESRFKLDDFELYKHARDFRRQIYSVIKKLPPEEKYCLAPQMRRAALSISNNIAEGHGRWHYLENIRFCSFARGSTEEIIDDLNTCIDERYAEEQLLLGLKEQGYQLVRRINGYIRYLRNCQQQ
jgi:four helix bundle protein